MTNTLNRIRDHENSFSWKLFVMCNQVQNQDQQQLIANTRMGFATYKKKFITGSIVFLDIKLVLRI